MIVQHVKVVGYYDKQNLGDDQYKQTIPRLLESLYPLVNFTFQFFKITEFKDESITGPEDLIILGGGDIFTSYFIDPFYAVVKDLTNKTIALSVGFPYYDMLVHPIFKRLDLIYLRTLQDVHVFESLGYGDKVFHIPDTSFLLPSMLNPIVKPGGTPLPTWKAGYACISLNCHCESLDMDRVAELVETMILPTGLGIVLIPFCTLGNESDTPYHHKLATILRNKYETLKIIVAETNDLLRVYSLYYHASFALVMRFHSVLIAYMTDTPFYSIVSTRKITNFLKDVQWPWHVDVKHYLTADATATADATDIAPKIPTFEEIKSSVQVEQSASWTLEGMTIYLKSELLPASALTLTQGQDPLMFDTTNLL